MKLRPSPTSPYVRKVMIAAIELGLDGDIEIVSTDPWDAESDISDANPLGKVPALVTDDGTTILDSSVICEYLDSLHDGPPLVPPAGDGRWQARRWQVLGDGILDACVQRRVEGKFHDEAMQSAAWIARQKTAVGRALAALEREAPTLGQGPLTLGHISVGAALGYLDLRFPEDDWRAAHPALAQWYADFAQRPSMAATAPGK